MSAAQLAGPSESQAPTQDHSSATLLRPAMDSGDEGNDVSVVDSEVAAFEDVFDQLAARALGLASARVSGADDDLLN